MKLLAILIAVALAATCSGCEPSTPPAVMHLGGTCMGVRPICSPGLHPECICYDAFGNNCSWQCVR